MQIPGVHLETIAKPQLYSEHQLDHACQIAQALNRGKLVLCTVPDARR